MGFGFTCVKEFPGIVGVFSYLREFLVGIVFYLRELLCCWFSTCARRVFVLFVFLPVLGGIWSCT